MMYPVLAKVRYDRLDAVTGDRRLMVSSLVINWIVGPAVMFALAWIFLPDLPEYRTGLIIVGLARCIAMVIIWNDLACGDREAAAVLVALNSVFQVLAFGLLGWFYLDLLPGWLGLGDGQRLDISVWQIALNVVIFLGVPLLAGFLTRRVGEKKMGRERLRGERSCRGSARGPCTGCCSRSSSSSPCRGRRSPRSRWTSPGSRCRCWCTSRSCSSAPSSSARPSAWPTTAPRPWRSPRRATTSSWPSRSPSPPSASPPARPCPASSARSSRSRS